MECTIVHEKVTAVVLAYYRERKLSKTAMIFILKAFIAPEFSQFDISNEEVQF